MNATIVNNGAAAIPVTVWMGAQPTDDSLMLAVGGSVNFANDQIGRVDCGVVRSNLTRMVHSLPAVSAVLVSFIQSALQWYNTLGIGTTSLKVTVTNMDADHGIYAVCGSLADQRVVPVNQSMAISVRNVSSPVEGKYVLLRPVGFDQFTGPRGGSIPP